MCGRKILETDAIQTIIYSETGMDPHSAGMDTLG